MFFRVLKYTVYAVMAAFVVLLVARQVVMRGLPNGEKVIPGKVVQEEIPVPRRPGTMGIRIVGPPLKVVHFQLDFTRNPEPLDWNFLERTDKKTDVMVEGNIDANGNFTITRIRDKGHPKAGRYIKSVLKTWKFLQYKLGTVKYYFNVPTRYEHMKVQIDLRGLRKNLKFIGPREYLKTGVLYYIDGLNRNNIMILK